MTTSYSPAHNKNINGTHPFDPDHNTTALLCQSSEAAKKAECLRHILCLPPLQPSQPAHVKAYESTTTQSTNKNDANEKGKKVIETQMWMADMLLDLVHKATCGSVSTQYHHEWHKTLHTADAKFQDEVVPYDNIVRPPTTTLFPDIDDNRVGSMSPSRDTAGGRSVMLLRHAAEIAPSSGHVEGDYSINTHDKSIHTTEEKDSASPQRLRITSKAALSPETTLASPSRQNRTTSGAIVDASPSSPSPNNEEYERQRQLRDEDGFEHDHADYQTREELLADAEQRRHIREEEERKKQEEEAKKLRIQLFKWNLNVFRATDDSDAICFAANPLSATAIHRCSIQILAMNNDPQIPPGSTVLSNGVFDRPGCCFGLCHKSVLDSKENSARSDLWNGMLWKCDRDTSLPGAALMVAKSASGKPIAELPSRGKMRENSEHYIRVGDILTVETRPATSQQQQQRGTGFFDAIFNNKQQDTSVKNNNNQQEQQLVSAHFFINNVEVFSWSNIALLQPYCRATKGFSSDPELSRCPFSMDFMYFGVRLWRGTEVAIVSGDPSRIVSAEMI